MNPKLLAILGCPREESRPSLELKGTWLICTSCGYGFRIENNIPNLLPEDAVPPEELEELLNA